MVEVESGGLIISPNAPKQEKTTEDLILSGALDLGELVDNIEQTVFCLDISGSMAASVSGSWNTGPEDPPKIKLLKKSLERYISNRFQKNPDSRVGLVAFESRVHMLIDITDDERALLKKAAALKPMGSTRMDKGLKKSILLLKKSSKNWIPRIVVISDGAPDSRSKVVEVIENNKNLRIIIDALYIGQENESWGGLMHIEFMRELAERTGGVFEHISSKEEFDTKFLAVANRSLLTAGVPESKEDVSSHQGGVIHL